MKEGRAEKIWGISYNALFPQECPLKNAKIKSSWVCLLFIRVYTKCYWGLFWAETHPPSKFCGIPLCFCEVSLTNQPINRKSHLQQTPWSIFCLMLIDFDAHRAFKKHVRFGAPHRSWVEHHWHKYKFQVCNAGADYKQNSSQQCYAWRTCMLKETCM